MPFDFDRDLSSDDIRGLTSVDAVAAFLNKLGYPTGCRKEELASAYGLNPDTQDAVRRMELLAADDEAFFRILFVQLKSLTAKTRTELVRNLGRLTTDHLLILTKDFLTTEFVLIDKETRDRGGAARGPGVHPVPRIVTVARKEVGTRELRVLRRLTWTCKDGLDQFHKLRSVFESAHYSSRYFENRALFADHFLEARLPENAAWSDSPNEAYDATKALMAGARSRWAGKDEQTARNELFAPAWKLLGFKPQINKTAKQDHPTPDYFLHGANGKPIAAAFVYRWDRWLDGADPNDPDTPDENPGAAVVSTLAKGDARWVIVTNGKRWRLYSRDAHSRATNFYEVDLEEALADADDTDPNRAFRYWWLFFRREAFEPLPDTEQEKCWLDELVQGSRDYAKRLGDRLKNRVFLKVFPLLAEGFLTDRRKRLGLKKPPTDQELTDMFEATLTLLYRLLFLLYAEARDLLPIGEAPYGEASLKRIKDEIADKAGKVESEASEKLKVYSEKTTDLYDRLGRLFAVMDLGDPSVNVPCYNGGLFVTDPPPDSDMREHHIARFLLDHKVPDRFLSLAIDRLARDPDEKTLGLVFIDYKSLEVRHLGSIYEGLLEFKLKIAEEDLTTKMEKKREKYIPLSQVKPGRGRKKNAPIVVVRKGAVYISNDKAERKASGSYYTPDPIVQYIVEHTVGPVLEEKLEALRPELSKAGKTFHRHVTNSKNHPELVPEGADPRELAAAQAYAEHRHLVDRVFDMKILDPAMGSGHFLVEAVDFVTDRLLDFLNRFPHNPVRFMLEQTRRSILSALTEQGVTVDADKLTDVNLLKRHVLKRSIYGVDLNPMAVELAKVSLWLDAFTLGAPLSFLDHHLRCGNSLIGESDISEHILGTERQRELRQTVKNMMEISRTADANLEDITASKKLFEEAQGLVGPFKNRLHIETAKHFLGFKDDVHSNMTGFPHDKAFDPNRPPKGKERSHATYLEVLRTAGEQRFFHWELEFPEVFFGFADVNQRHLKHKNDVNPGSAGFDTVIGNPPYDVLSSKEIGRDISDFQAYVKGLKQFGPARGGKQNLYKLFICCGEGILRREARIGHIVPMALLGDEQAAGVRRLLTSAAPLRAVEAFPQKDDPNNRVFPEAKLSTCVFVSAKSQEKPPFRSRVHPGRDILERSPSVLLRPENVGLYDPENRPILACSQDDWDLAVRIVNSGRVKRLGEFCEAFQGEVNETGDRAKGNISANAKDGQQVLRGSNLCLYVLRDASQGEAMFLRKARYLRGKKPDTKAWHHEQQRVGLQESCPQNNFRRIIASFIPAEQFCNHKINYFPEGSSRLSLHVVLALLNSKLADWYFRLGSTSASVSHFQLYNLPAPDFEVTQSQVPGADATIRSALMPLDAAAARTAIEPLLRNPPFGTTVLECMKLLAQKIIDIEDCRGEIKRTERSALDPKAQPLQDLLDHMIYRMAGLTDVDIAGLEERLARML